MPALDTAFYAGVIMGSVALVSAASLGVPGLVGHILNFGVFRQIGIVSYGVYLYHNIAAGLLNEMYRSEIIPEVLYNGAPGIFLKTVLTFGMTYLSWFAVEQPINRMKRYFSYSAEKPGRISAEGEIMAAQASGNGPR